MPSKISDISTGSENHLSPELSTGSYSSTTIIPSSVGSTTPSNNSTDNTCNKRRVSIVNTPPGAGGVIDNNNMSSTQHHLAVPSSGGGGGGGGYDNHGYESSNRRRVSIPNNSAEVGPVRKKSILHNSTNNSPENAHPYHFDPESGKHVNGDARTKKSSVTDSIYSRASRTRFSDVNDDTKSWFYTFCLNCRKTDTIPSWSPPGYSKYCPHPFCPSYRQYARVLALFIIGLLTWGVVYAMVGEMAAPGGQLFGLAMLSIAAHFGGWLMTLTTLPALIGMLIVGMLFQNAELIDLSGDFKEVTSHLRKIALVIILTRAGLDLDPEALRRLKYTVMKIGLIPWTLEAILISITTHFFMGLPWKWGLLLGSIVAAVSPAVIVPCLLRLREKGYGVAKGIPTLVIAVSGIDDAASVAVFGIISSIMFSTNSIAFQVLQGPLSIIGGIAFGVIWGWVAQYVPEKEDPFVVPLRILMLLGGGLVAVFGSELVHFDGAGPLGCIAAAFFSSVFWSKQGWEVDENPAGTAFEIFWMIFEPILFGITGTQIKFQELDPHIVYKAIGCLLIGIILRLILTIIIGIGCKLNLKEKIFIAIACSAKATVQAALGPVALHTLQDEQSDQKEFAEQVLMVCILSIILTAPTGAILISVTGPRLLSKTRTPVILEGWRRSHRPSIRDISIIDEEEERDAPEKIINNIS